MKFENKLEEDYFSNRMQKGEIARYSMIALCEYFVKNKTMTEKNFFDVQKEAFTKWKSDAEVGTDVGGKE